MFMWGWKPTWWEAILIIIFVIVSSIACFPCWLLQKIGFKASRYAGFLIKAGLEDLSYFILKVD
jgi:hypothetical protein